VSGDADKLERPGEEDAGAAKVGEVVVVGADP
jgi:hypothetical protein